MSACQWYTGSAMDTDGRSRLNCQETAERPGGRSVFCYVIHPSEVELADTTKTIQNEVEQVQPQRL
jgi:hypothetical protein